MKCGDGVWPNAEPLSARGSRDKWVGKGVSAKVKDLTELFGATDKR
jgi:hypothetical protein